MNINLVKRTHVLQQDQKDCGIACLLSLTRFYGGNSSFENLRQISGTDISGTSLLGLQEAAIKLGFIAEGCKSNIQGLIQHGRPVVLHVEIENNFQHYVICYGKSNEEPNSPDGPFIIGDPAKGVQNITESELSIIWKSGTCLTLIPSNNFIAEKIKNREKKDWFLNILKKDIQIISASVIISLLVGALGLSMAIYSQQLIDVILPSKNVNRIIISTLLVVILLLGRVGLTALRQFLLLRQNKEFGERLNLEFYSRLLNLPKSFFDSRKTGDFVARLNDTSRIKNIVSVLAGNLLVDIFISISSIILLLYYNWAIGLICIAVVPIQFFLIYSKNTQIVNAQKKVMVSYSVNEGNYINSIQGICDIKNRNKQDFFGELNEALYGKFQEAAYRSGIIQIKVSNLSGIISILLISIVLSLSIYKVHMGFILIGEMTAILSIVSTLLPAINNLALISIPVNEAKVAFDRMYEYSHHNSLSEVKDPAPMDFNQIDLNNISFRFPGKPKILHNISLQVKKGEIISIVSESGSGKSLICQLIQKFYNPDSGEIIINGNISLSSIENSSWRDIVSIVPQHVHLFNGNVIHNICLSNSINDIQESINLLQIYGFIPFFESLPQGIMTNIGEGGISLSGGQKQIIGLARALVTRPKMLILDEATASLDRYNERFVLDLLMRLKEEMAIIFITHRLHTLRNTCNRIYLLENGHISESGDHKKLMLSSNIYSDYWFSWTELSNLSIPS